MPSRGRRTTGRARPPAAVGGLKDGAGPPKKLHQQPTAAPPSPAPQPDGMDSATAHPNRSAACPRRGLLPDYNRAAAVYGWLLAASGAAALGASVQTVAGGSAEQVGQIIVLVALAMVVGLFPLRVPGSKNSIAAGDIFVFLSLLLFGPAAAVIGAAAEAGACAWRTSSRWSSRIASAAAAALAMATCGHLVQALAGALAAAGVGAEAAVFSAALLFAAAYFVVSPTLVTTVKYLERRRAPSPAEWLTSFGWLGMGYGGSASVAGVLFLAFRQFGVTSVLVAAPMIAMFLTTLHFQAAQRQPGPWRGRASPGRRGPAPA